MSAAAYVLPSLPRVPVDHRRRGAGVREEGRPQVGGAARSSATREMRQRDACPPRRSAAIAARTSASIRVRRCSCTAPRRARRLEDRRAPARRGTWRASRRSRPATSRTGHPGTLDRTEGDAHGPSERVLVRPPRERGRRDGRRGVANRESPSRPYARGPASDDGFRNQRVRAVFTRPRCASQSARARRRVSATGSCSPLGGIPCSRVSHESRRPASAAISASRVSHSSTTHGAPLRTARERASRRARSGASSSAESRRSSASRSRATACRTGVSAADIGVEQRARHDDSDRASVPNARPYNTSRSNRAAENHSSRSGRRSARSVRTEHRGDSAT